MSEIRITYNDFDSDKVAGKSTLEIAIRITSLVKTLLSRNVRTGRLRNSYMWKVENQKGGLNDQAGMMQDVELSIMPERNGGVVGSACEYALYPEMGTRRMAPIPALRPAAALVTTDNEWNAIATKIAQEKNLGVLKEGQERINFFEVKS